METILTCENIKVNFDGFWALKGVDLNVEKNDIHFLIGPNGAGKSTLMDIICGKTKSTEGKVFFNKNQDITNLKDFKRVDQGIARKFQTPSIFLALTVEENLEISLKQKRGIFSLLTARKTTKQKKQLEDVLQLIGLEDERDLLAGSLSHGKKQWLEIGMQIIMDPKLLLLDEPIAGMTGKEREKTGELLHRIRKQCSILVVEHDMDFVRNVSSKVTVMHEGKVLCEGSIDEVTANEEVARVYLGQGEKHAND